MYQAVYGELCIHSHNNIRALDDRHIEQSGNDCHIVFFRANQQNEIEHFVENISGCIVDALRRVGEIARYKKGTNFDTVDRTFEEPRIVPRTGKRLSSRLAAGAAPSSKAQGDPYALLGHVSVSHHNTPIPRHAAGVHKTKPARDVFLGFAFSQLAKGKCVAQLE
jgi:hypothetical protein